MAKQTISAQIESAMSTFAAASEARMQAMMATMLEKLATPTLTTQPQIEPAKVAPVVPAIEAKPVQTETAEPKAKRTYTRKATVSVPAPVVPEFKSSIDLSQAVRASEDMQRLNDKKAGISSTVEEIEAGDFLLQHDLSTGILTIVMPRNNPMRGSQNGSSIIGTTGYSMTHVVFDSGLELNISLKAYYKEWVSRPSSYEMTNFKFEADSEELRLLVNLRASGDQTTHNGVRVANTHGNNTPVKVNGNPVKFAYTNQGKKEAGCLTVNGYVYVKNVPQIEVKKTNPVATKVEAKQPESQAKKPAKQVQPEPKPITHTGLADSMDLFVQYSAKCHKAGIEPSMSGFKVWLEIAKEAGML